MLAKKEKKSYKMQYFIFSIILVLFIAILYVWWKSSKLYNLPLEQKIELHRSENRVVDYSKLNSHLGWRVIPEDTAAWAKLIHTKIYSTTLEIPNKYWVIGANLPHLYQQKYKKALKPALIWNLRTYTGLNVQLVLIINDKERQWLRDQAIFPEDVQRLLLLLIHENNTFDAVKNYLHQLLNERWKVLEKYIKCDENDRSYAYVNSDQIQQWNISTDEYSRINMLCSDLEFEQLYRRLQTFTPLLTELN
jgi:septum formation topological specificity factor MinE